MTFVWAGHKANREWHIQSLSDVHNGGVWNQLFKTLLDFGPFKPGITFYFSEFATGRYYYVRKLAGPDEPECRRRVHLRSNAAHAQFEHLQLSRPKRRPTQGAKTKRKLPMSILWKMLSGFNCGVLLDLVTFWKSYKRF